MITILKNPTIPIPSGDCAGCPMPAEFIISIGRLMFGVDATCLRKLNACTAGFVSVMPSLPRPKKKVTR